MTNAITENISLIVLLPLWIFLIIMCGRFLGVYVNNFIIRFLTVFSSFLGIIITLFTLSQTEETYIWSTPFLQINNFIIPFGIYIDRISLIIALILYIISFLVQIYSVSYIKGNNKEYRFFALLNLFNFSMTGMLFSPNMFQMYVFWELVGVVSYLFIGFDYTQNAKSESSKRVFLINRIGDTALIGGIILSSYFMYSYVADKSLAALSFENMNDISPLLSVYTSTPEFLIVTGLFVIAAAVKSAQFPFYTWLQDAMEAHLPVSALLHSATMVVAGVYLIIRLLPIFTLNTFIMKIILLVGLFTAIICSVLASVETHPKKILAYSTSASLGLMFISLGLENVKAALLFLIAHAFIKSMLFLELPHKDNKISYTDLIFFIFGGLSLAGIIFAGLSTKEFLFANIKNPIVSYLFALISFLTALYITRLVFIVIKSSTLYKKINIAEVIPAAVLMILNVFFYLKLRTSVDYYISLPFYTAITGVITASIIQKTRLADKLSETPKLLEKFYNNILAKLYKNISEVCDFIDNKIFSNHKPAVFISKLLVKSMNFIEENVMNKTVSLTSDSLKEISKIDSVLQTKNIQTYNAYAFVIITCIITLVILSYKFILEYMS